MKKVLSLLVAFVFLQVQSWALSGGPDYGAQNNSVTGTFAGVLLGSLGSNGLGLFQIGQPSAGLGSGTFAFFEGGGAFFGTVVALADPNASTMNGILKGALDIQIFGTTGNGGNTSAVTIPVALLGGQFIAKLKGSAATAGSLGVGATLVGTASVNVTASNAPNPFKTGGAGNAVIPLPDGVQTGNFTLTMTGFEQSSDVTGQVSLSSLTGTTPASGG